MTIQILLRNAYKKLSHKSQSPQLDSELLLAHVLKKNRSYVISHMEKNLSKKQERQFRSLIARRERGEPIAYLTGRKEFYGLEFLVNPSVLIPRPETEILVDFVWEHITHLISKRKKKRIKIIDVGTGSGNIGVTIIAQIIKKQFYRKSTFVFYCTDISGPALTVTKKNYKRLVKKKDQIKVYFVKTDLLSGFDPSCDIIVSNLPYIPSGDIDGLMKDVKDFEPKMALNGGERGLYLIRKLISQGVPILSDEGKMFLEIHEDHPLRIRYFMKEHFPHAKVSFEKDMFGQWRFAIISQISKVKTPHQRRVYLWRKN